MIARWWLFVSSLMAQPVMGQGTWSYVEDFGPYQALVRDMVEMPDGGYVAATMASGLGVGLPGQCWLTKFGAEGALLYSERVWEPGTDVIVSVLQPLGDDKFRAFGTTLDPDSLEAFFHFDSNWSLQGLDSGTFAYSALQQLIMDNIIPLPDGGAVILGSAADGIYHWNKGVTVQVAPNGSMVRDHIFDGANNALVLRHGLVDPDGSYWITCKRTPVELGGLSAKTSVIHLAPDFSWIDGYPSPNVFGSGSLTAPDSVLDDQMELRRLPGGNLIMAGRLGDWLYLGYYHSIVMKMTGSGEVQDMAYFDSPFPFDQVGVLSSMCDAPEDDFYFAYVENMAIASQVDASNIRVLRMDTSLNVLCEWLVEGIAEGAYYNLQRIKATSDGGFMLLGGRRQIGDATLNAWARKFTGTDCNAGTAGHDRTRRDMIFPNPGSSGFTWTSETLQTGTFTLFDAIGREVWTNQVQSGLVKATGLWLKPGVYHYRVVDQSGSRILSGLWLGQ